MQLIYKKILSVIYAQNNITALFIKMGNYRKIGYV